MCAVMIVCTPAAIAARNGTSASSISPSTVGSSRCESSAVAPWPGKCFAHAATPFACRPVTNAATWRATSSGSAPKARIPITGFCGFTFTSATGAKSRFTPTAASSAPIERATRSVSSTSSTTPSARVPGIRRALGPLEPRDVAALLVDRDEEPVGVGAQRGGERRELRAVDHVRGEERDAAEAAVEQPPDPVGRLGPLEAREQARRREPFEPLAHPRTAPAVSPNAIRRCTSRKKIDDRDRGQHRRRHQPAPVGAVARPVEAREPHRQRLLLLVGEEDVGEDELVPRLDEAEDRGRDEAGRDEREQDLHEGAGARVAVDHRRLLEVARDPEDEAAQDPDRERQHEREVRDDHAR